MSELQDLILKDSLSGKVFRDCICQYNSTLMFTLLGYKNNNYPENQQGQGFFQIYKKLYYLQDLLESKAEELAQYF